MDEISTEPNDDNVINADDTGSKRAVFVRLKNIHFSDFNMLVFVKDGDDLHYFLFTQQTVNLSKGTLMKQIIYIVQRLVDELGPDTNGNAALKANEIKNNQWDGRTWLVDECMLKIDCPNNIYPFLSFRLFKGIVKSRMIETTHAC